MFYVTHYNKTSKSGPEEGGWYTEGWVVDWSEPCKTEEDAVKLLGDYYKEFYNTENTPEDLDDSFEDNDELFIIEDEANRGHLHSEPLSWIEAESEDYEVEQPVFDSEGVAHFPNREKRDRERQARHDFIKKVKSLEEYTKDKEGGKNAPKVIFVLDDNIKEDKIPVGFIFTGRNINEEDSKKFIEDLLKDKGIDFEYNEVNFANVDKDSDANAESVASISVYIPIPKLNESLKKVDEDFYDPQRHNDLRDEVKDTIRELILNNVEDNLEQVLGSKVKGYLDFYPNYPFGNHEKDSIERAREQYIRVLTDAALNTHFTEDISIEDNKEVIKESQEDDDVFVVCDHCLAAIESHEGNQITTEEIPEDRLYEAETDSDGNVELFGICDWCGEEFTEDELVRIL